MEAIAITKNSRGSAQKARLVIDMIRGLSVNDALAILIASVIIGIAMIISAAIHG